MCLFIFYSIIIMNDIETDNVIKENNIIHIGNKVTSK